MNDPGLNIDNSVGNSFEDFFSAVDYFTGSRDPGLSIVEVINRSIDIFLKIPHSISCSIFILDYKSFDLQHNSTKPYTYKKSVLKFYNTLVERGVVGNALQQTKIFRQNKDIKDGIDFPCYLIPLIGNNGVTGLILCILSDMPVEEEPGFERICSLFAGFLAHSIENLSLNQNIRDNDDTLDQRIAHRTMELENDKIQLNSIFDSVHTGILVIDAETNKIIKANPVSAKIIGNPESKLIGRDYYKHLDFNGLGVSAPDKPVTDKNFESELKKANGEVLPILRTTSMIRVGTISFRIESFLDISERKQAESALKDANELLEMKVQERTEELQVLVHTLKEQIKVREDAENEILKMLEKEKVLNELKTKFISMVSHEFRTPLTIIRTSAQLVEKFDDKLSFTEKTEYLQRIVKTVDFMKDLIENAIFIGQTDTERVKIKPVKLNIDEYCHNLINDLLLGMDIKREVDYSATGEPVNIKQDPKLIRNILVNLLLNAIKFSENNSYLGFRLESGPNMLKIIVIDKGIGIPDEEQEDIFELFYRGSNVGKVSGTGLGLSVVMRSLRLLNGKIDLYSKLNEGSVFTVTIPHLN